MASNQTQHLKLSQWEAEDQVLRADFNADNAKIDAAVGELRQADEQKASVAALNALAQTVAGKFGADNMPWVVGVYTGNGYDGKESQEIVLGFVPKVLIIVGDAAFGVAASFGENRFCASILPHSTSTASTLSTYELALTDNGFRVTRNSIYGPTINGRYVNYVYFALR